jgi:cell surface protein SprA
MANQGYLTKNTSMTMPFSQVQNKQINLRMNLEPTPDLKIQLDVKKETSASYQEIFRFNEDSLKYTSLSPNRTGSYKISFITINTAFDNTNRDLSSNVFKKFEENLLTIQKRFGGDYDTASQDVTIPAFLAAYSGKNAATINLTPFPSTPLPNWRLDYTGLTKIKGIKDLFQSVTISHAYNSTYSVSNYSNSLKYNDPQHIGINVPIENYNSKFFGKPDSTGHVTPVYVISQVLISEQFAPLIGINVKTKSRITANFQYKTKRDLSLNVSNAQLTEINNKDVSFELGFTKNNMKLPFKAEGRTIVLKNDVTFRLNITVSDTKQIQRKINELNTITNGNVNYQLRPNINYVVNQKLNLQVYFERTVNDPYISSSYKRSTTRFGVQVRFSLAQ